ncbi:MAG: WG repeat-containing protein [Bacteroidales bacterium]|nr:WG repeat-containing protein [Bacteroidales bacterium]
MKRIFTTILAVLLVLQGAEAQSSLPRLSPLQNMKDALYPKLQNGKWGYANSRNKFIIRPVFDSAEHFFRVGAQDGSVMDVAKVRIGSSWGYVSREGIWFIEPAYESITDFNFYSVAFGKSGVSYTMIGVEPFFSLNLGEKVVKAVILDEGFDEVPLFRSKGIAVARKSGKYGILKSTGSWLVPCDNDSIGPDSDFDMYKLVKGGLIGYSTYGGEIVFPVEYKSLGWFSEGVVLADKGKVGLFKADGSALIPVEYDSIGHFASSFILRSGGKVGLATPSGKIIIPVEYEAIEQMSNGNFMVKGADGYNVYGPDCTLLFPISFDSLTLDPSLGYIVTKDGLYGRLDSHGKYLYPPVFEDVPDPERKGYIEMMVDGVPYIFLAGESVPRKVSDYDDMLYRQMSDRGYAASTILPAWLKGHLGRGRIENKVTLKSEGDIEDVPALVCYTFHEWAGCFEVAVCPDGGGVYMEVVPGAKINLELEWVYPKIDLSPDEDMDREEYLAYLKSGEFDTFEMLVHEPAENGIALYEIIGTRHHWRYNRGIVKETGKDTPVTVAYGFIGLGCEYFVQPLFLEARAFEGDTAQVRIGSDWLSLTKEQLAARDPFIQPL